MIDQGTDFLLLTLEDPAFELFAVGWIAGLEQVEDGEGEFAASQIGAEGFAGSGFVSGDVEAVVVDLVGSTEAKSEGFEVFDGVRLGAVESGTEFGGDGEERPRFHFEDAIVIGDGELEVEAALGLDDFARTDLACGLGEAAAHGGVVEFGGEFEGVCEEGVT